MIDFLILKYSVICLLSLILIWRLFVVVEILKIVKFYDENNIKY